MWIRKDSLFYIYFKINEKKMENVKKERKPKGYWTKERCKEVALLCSTKIELSEKYLTVKNIIYKNNWIGELCSHMIEFKKRNGYWNYERCKDDALKYDKIKDFEENSPSAYASARKNGWFYDICSHINYKHVLMRKPADYWNYERCKYEALKYESRSEFMIINNSAYRSSIKNGWLDELCSHMIPVGNLHKRSVYLYEFEDGNVYIGLTMDINKRHYTHMKRNGRVYNHIQKTGLIPKFTYGEYIDVIDAQQLEIELIKQYKNDSNYHVLNKSNGGEIGNATILSYSMCLEISSKYDKMSIFKKEKYKIYKMCDENNWLVDICSHMTCDIKEKIIYNYDKCKELSLLCKNRRMFKNIYSTAYRKSIKNDWLNDFFKRD